MTIRHHPTEETLAAFACASLDEGNTLVVAAHVARCPLCRQTVRLTQNVASVMIDRAPRLDLADGTRARVLERLAHPESLPVVSSSNGGAGGRAPRDPVSLYDGGDWRWIGVGVQWKPLEVNTETGTRVFMLKAAPGTRLPDHRHVGTEWTCVLEGAFSHQLGRFGPGDFDEADDAVEHSPFVEREGACICLVALNGRIELKSWIGRMIQPFVQI